MMNVNALNSTNKIETYSNDAKSDTKPEVQQNEKVQAVPKDEVSLTENFVKVRDNDAVHESSRTNRAISENFNA